MDFKSYLLEKAKFVNSELEKMFTNSDTISKASRYSLLAGGKRLRPVLNITVFEALNGKGNILPLSLAIEFIHTYSLIHDDLPAMDNDDLRRGKPTSHKMFGESIAILAGDTLLTEAFNLISKLEFDSSRVIRTLSYLSDSSGYKGMIGGQVLDIENNLKNINLDYLIKTSHLKTGALIRASVVTPAIILNKDYEKLEVYGNSIGLAFQIIDDVLGTTSTKEKLGKSINIDEENNKITFVNILGVDKSIEMAKEEVNKAKEAISCLGCKYLTDLADYIVNRKK